MDVSDAGAGAGFILVGRRRRGRASFADNNKDYKRAVKTDRERSIEGKSRIPYLCYSYRSCLSVMSLPLLAVQTLISKSLPLDGEERHMIRSRFELSIIGALLQLGCQDGK